ncbi:MerR family transcriptional regulator [Streptomyces sp. NBC_01317]|uniref:MerR family transcriptional regulator n=1 Tax=Streptomyces sp. NBC_01317 TaxID=2903822 RepID=UPI002E135434|nr:MerR family transcriptional regulator [Streptomyces sp. NBC_01317]
MTAATGEQAVGLTIQEMARRSGFSEPTLRYYEKIGLLGTVGRDESSGHRRYEPDTAARIEALSCLRSAGMTVSGMRRYLDLLAQGAAAAADQQELFAAQARKLAADIEQLQLRLTYLRRKADLWDARVRGDAEAEKRAVDDVIQVVEKFSY